MISLLKSLQRYGIYLKWPNKNERNFSDSNKKVQNYFNLKHLFLFFDKTIKFFVEWMFRQRTGIS